MSKGLKIFLIILVVFFLVVAIIGGALFWWGREKLKSLDGDSVVEHIEEAMREEGVEISLPEEGVEKEGKIKSDIHGVPLPEVKLRKTMEVSAEDSFQATYSIESEEELDEIRSSYISDLKDEGWELEEELFEEGSHLYFLANEKGDSLVVELYEGHLGIFHDDL